MRAWDNREWKQQGRKLRTEERNYVLQLFYGSETDCMTRIQHNGAAAAGKMLMLFDSRQSASSLLICHS